MLQGPALKIGAKRLITASPTATVAEAVKTMRDKDVGALSIINDEPLVGMLTERDLFKLASA
jgi:CBS domain-containing protein